jgi:hypothetical protein
MRHITAQLLTIVIILSLLLPLSCTQSTSPPNDTPEPSHNLPKATIIDQLYNLQPNEAFIQQITQELESYGFEVHLYQGNEVTVDLYRSLPSLDYKLIIFRAHSGLLSGEEGVVFRTCLFTNEPYSQTKHVAEQLSDQLTKARINEHHPWVFAIADEFVTKSMEGQFDNTVIIAMGCSCLYLDDLAQAFVAKGASAYLAWDATVDLGYVDRTTTGLIKNLCSQGLTLKEAVALTMSTEGPDPQFGAALKYFPARSGSKTLGELM